MSARHYRQSSPRRFSLELLEDRSMMAGIPALSSLAGAAQTLFLDFDGDTLATWNRTDSNQTYTNVTAGEFNLDNIAGISNDEAAVIRKIWQSVADDYAPFNINVTTVAPASFANGVSLRVVMAGDTSATLRSSDNKTFNMSGTVFIGDDKGVADNTSGYAALNSYTNGEPNTVYVFAKYINTWGTTDSEGRYRDLQYVMATTASHEAGHAFGLEHHGNYDVGTNITTPIMGSNTQGDRSLWSNYYVGNVQQNNLTQLANVIGARADDYSGSYATAINFPISYSPYFGYQGSISGIVGLNADTDLFRMTINGTSTYNFNLTVPAFGNLDAKLILYRVTSIPFFGYYYENIAMSDPALSASNPFSGLGASFQVTLQAGTYAVAVQSHGGYGDLGMYTLGIFQPSIIYVDPGLLLYSSETTSTPTKSSTSISKTGLSTSRSGGAGSSAGVEYLATATTTLAPMTAKQDKLPIKPSKLRMLDDLFAKWE